MRRRRPAVKQTGLGQHPDRGAIVPRYPVGATGALERTGGRRALVTMCIGGGQGIALAFERLAA